MTLTRDEVRQRGREDLIFLARLLGYTKLHPGIHSAWARWAMQPTKRRIFLAPRLTYKTSLLTIAYAVQVLLKDPNKRILLCSDTLPRAQNILREIARHFSHGREFKSLYGDLSTRNSDTWNQSAIVLSSRTRNLKEPSIMAAGKGDQLVSGHYDVILASDVVTNRDRDSANERERTRQFMADAVSLVELDGLIQAEGTRWHKEDWYGFVQADLNTELIATGEAPYALHSESCYDEEGKPLFVEIGLTEAKLEALKAERGSVDFAANYLNSPIVPGSQIFSEEDFQYYDSLPPAHECQYYGFLDPALRVSERSDFSAIVVLARHRETGQTYVAHVDVARRPPMRTRSAVVTLFHTYRFEKFGVESNGAFDLLVDEIEEDLQREYQPFKIQRVVNTKDKYARIASSESRIKQLLLPRQWRQMSMEFRQLYDYPSTHDDLPDALASCVEMMGQGASYEQLMNVMDLNLHQGMSLGGETARAVSSTDRITRKTEW